MGFLLLVSLVISAGLAALSGYVNAWLPLAGLVLQSINFVISLALISLLFAAIYKVLPDKKLEWRDVVVGAVATAILFNLGKLLVGLYIGGSAIASSYGAAGGADYRPPLDLLLRANLPARGRVHQGLRQPPWNTAGGGSAQANAVSRRLRFPDPCTTANRSQACLA